MSPSSCEEGFYYPQKLGGAGSSPDAFPREGFKLNA